jgi:hypothetical protein
VTAVLIAAVVIGVVLVLRVSHSHDRRGRAIGDDYGGTFSGRDDEQNARHDHGGHDAGDGGGDGGDGGGGGGGDGGGGGGE